MSRGMRINMSTFGKRLGEEIDRLKNISQIAKRLGVARNTIYNWIAKGNVPLDKLMDLGDMGVDVQYIISGVRTFSVDQVAEEHPEYRQKQKEEAATEAGLLSPRDRIWLEIGQQLSDDDRTRLQEIGATLVSARDLKKTKNQ
ncbi:MAG: helix-turn-helix domain-containing protein [Taibaiella sp.]|nr:helix-turn-helix domain-containing protein [Taibaiella sp.]